MALTCVAASSCFRRELRSAALSACAAASSSALGMAVSSACSAASPDFTAACAVAALCLAAASSCALAGKHSSHIHSVAQRNQPGAAIKTMDSKVKTTMLCLAMWHGC